MSNAAALLSLPLAITLRLGREYKLPVLMPSDLASYLDRLDLGPVDFAIYASAVAEIEKAGAPIIDHFRMTPGVTSVEAPAVYRSLLATLPSGLTFVALHCNASGDIETIVPPRAHWRTDEHRLFASGEPQRWTAEMGIVRLGYRRLRDLYRSALAV